VFYDEIFQKLTRMPEIGIKIDPFIVTFTWKTDITLSHPSKKIGFVTLCNAIWDETVQNMNKVTVDTALRNAGTILPMTPIF
jgi:hypothetical protein